jgi:hypothetical protein
MARIEWVRQRLENWALWHERGRGGGLGYATQSVLLTERVDGDRAEAWVPVDEVEAAVTDEAVDALKLGYGHLHKTLQLFYLRGAGIKETSRVMQRAESTIKAQLERADALLATWFADRKRRREAAAADLRAQLNSFTP